MASASSLALCRRLWFLVGTMNSQRFILAFLALLFGGCAKMAFRRVPVEVAPVRSAEFREKLASVAMARWTGGNAVRTLENGDNFFPSMLSAAASAKRSITFSCYTAGDGPPVADFSRVLAGRARAGVKVHVILDAFGCCWLGRRHIVAMREAGVQVEFYSPFRFYDPLAYSRRNHQRVLVVDGHTGFCGGAGYGDIWSGHASDSEHWRDTQYELHGPIVAQLQDNFNDNWRELTGKQLAGRDYYPPPKKAGAIIAQMVAGSPGKARDTIGGSFLLAIRAARKSVLIEQSYFIPPAPIVDALLGAAARGAKVQIIIPGEITDMPFAKEVTQRTLRRLMNGGVEIYEFRPTMMHGKLLTVDDHFVIAGSANFDPRSFFINEENNLHVLNSAFAREQRRMFERDKARSSRLTEETLHISQTRRLRGFVGQIVIGTL